MWRTILVLVTTLLFGLLGLLAGYLNVQALSHVNDGGRLRDTALSSFFGAPFGGAVLGFVLSVVSLMLFTRNTKA